MSRFTDDLHLVTPDDFVPHTVGALLKRAGVEPPMMEDGFGTLLDKAK